ncbi:MAG TPA: carboxypeptidase-like regulatory domain-containing protein [Chitinophagaceae bacterium]|nr:carboxypeptidase-like regulatory domain-containing protein [Chitinophagaceae bacterium]
MADNSSIRYSAEDIEKYLAGHLSDAAMHALERAALEDPFLADALEGYGAQAPGTAEDLQALRSRLADRVREASRPGGTRGVPRLLPPWLRVAAVLLVIAAGAAWFYLHILDRSASPNAGLASQTKSAAPGEQPLAPVPAADSTTTTTTGRPNDLIPGPPAGTGTSTSTIPSKKPATGSPTGHPASKEIQGDRQETLSAPGQPQARNLSVSLQADSSQAAPARLPAGVTRQPEALEKQVPVSQWHLFRGQVTGPDNMPLPFANVTTLREGVGTYTDVRGYFTLSSPDSVLEVRIRSIGYTSLVTALHPVPAPDRSAGRDRMTPAQLPRLVLKEDSLPAALTRIVDRDSTRDLARAGNNLVVEQPEPADGWTNYDTYVANNIQVPGDVREKGRLANRVVLSFEVNEQGQPVQIRVESGTCTTCAREAVRLLREGPRWKASSPGSRIHLTISF